MSRGEEPLVFRPSLAVVQSTSWEDYVTSLEPALRRTGICRVVAPAGWTPRAAGYGGVDLEIPTPVRQACQGAKGLFRAMLMEEPALRLAGRGGFAEQALAPQNQPPGGPGADVDELERVFWKQLPFNPPLYGADVEGSLFDEACACWNVSRLGTRLTTTLAATTPPARIPGVTSPYLYWGSWRAMFAWHTEDLDLYSVNYLHYGAPKTWYCVAPGMKERFERAAEGLAPELFRECASFLRHKELLLSPTLLKSLGVPFTRITQRAREFVITYPGAYHAGFNHGYNCAESTNFATAAWLPIGAAARACDCSDGCVSIDMALFGVPPAAAQRAAKRGRREEGAGEGGGEGGGAGPSGAGPAAAAAAAKAEPAAAAAAAAAGAAAAAEAQPARGEAAAPALAAAAAPPAAASPPPAAAVGHAAAPLRPPDPAAAAAAAGGGAAASHPPLQAEAKAAAARRGRSHAAADDDRTMVTP